MHKLIIEARKRLKEEGMKNFSVRLGKYGSRNQYVQLAIGYAPFTKSEKRILIKVFGELPEDCYTPLGSDDNYVCYPEVRQIKRIQKRFGMSPKDLIYK